jgi:hypothetical protein
MLIQNEKMLRRGRPATLLLFTLGGLALRKSRLAGRGFGKLTTGRKR